MAITKIDQCGNTATIWANGKATATVLGRVVGKSSNRCVLEYNGLYSVYGDRGNVLTTVRASDWPRRKSEFSRYM